MSRSFLILLATLGSAFLMLGALGFQYLGDMPPCKLCYWQRYPHVLAICVGLLALLTSYRILSYLGALATLSTAVIGVYHSGVERAWWPGPDTCTSGSVSGVSAEDLMAQIMAAPMVRCDEIPWEMLGLSMAGWNAVASLILFCIWIVAARRG